MKTTITVVLILVRLCFLVLLVLGIVFWTGHGLSLIPLHMIVGIVLVLGLWVTSLLAAVARAPLGLALTGLLWGVITIAFGMKQMTLLPGPSHWIIQVVHLLVGMGAIALNERLARLTLGLFERSSRPLQTPS
jgi:hypothetical protein